MERQEGRWSFGGVVGTLADGSGSSGQFQATYHPFAGGAEAYHYVFRPEDVPLEYIQAYGEEGGVEAFSYNADSNTVTFARTAKDGGGSGSTANALPGDFMIITITDGGKGEGGARSGCGREELAQRLYRIAVNLL